MNVLGLVNQAQEYAKQYAKQYAIEGDDVVKAIFAQHLAYLIGEETPQHPINWHAGADPIRPTQNQWIMVATVDGKNVIAAYFERNDMFSSPNITGSWESVRYWAYLSDLNKTMPDWSAK